MLKETGYQEKFVMIHPWLAEVIEGVKRDLKNEHFRQDPNFCRRHFMGKNPNQVTSIEMAPAYAKEVSEGNVGLGEFIATRWLLRHTDLYGFFEEKLKQINHDFEALDSLDVQFATPLMQEAVKQFGAKRTYLFSVLNSVVFPKAVYDKLRELALVESEKLANDAAEEEEAKTIDAIKKRHARDIASLSDRYEKKLSGMQRKYLADVAALKKQIQTLQSKLNDKSS